MKEQIPSFLLTQENLSVSCGEKKHSFPFIDRTIRNVARFIRTGYLQAESSSKNGLLQRIDARIMLLFLCWYTIQISLITGIKAQLCISSFLLLLFWISRLDVIQTYKRVFVISFFFGFLVIAPAALNLVNEGRIILRLFHFQDACQLWIYRIPSEIGITEEGMWVVFRLYLKIVNSITLTFLVLYTTPFYKLVKALKMLRVPDIFLLILSMTYKFIFILAHTTLETYLALKLKVWQKVKTNEANSIITGRIGYIFRKSWIRYENVFQAMVARGFTGNVSFYFTEKIKKTDFLFLVISIAIGLLIFLI